MNKIENPEKKLKEIYKNTDKLIKLLIFLIIPFGIYSIYCLIMYYLFDKNLDVTYLMIPTMLLFLISSIIIAIVFIIVVIED